MDSLILTFNKDQLNTYKELLTKDHIDLKFDTSLPQIEDPKISNFHEALSNIENEALTLHKLNKHSSAFSSFLTQEEIKELIPIYYTSIREIKRHQNIIGSDSWLLSFKISEINRISLRINKGYSDFLPYKAAFYNNEKYSLEISEIDNRFKESIEFLNTYKKELLLLFNKVYTVDTIIKDFIKKSAKASDEPKFKKFDSYDFFWTVEAFLEQIKAIQK
jgi:hemerythrin